MKGEDAQRIRQATERLAQTASRLAASRPADADDAGASRQRRHGAGRRRCGIRGGRQARSQGQLTRIGGSSHGSGNAWDEPCRSRNTRDRLKTLVQSAQTLALRGGHQQFDPLHVLKALLDDEDRAGGEPDRGLRQRFAKQIAHGSRPRAWQAAEGRRCGAGQVYLAPETARLFDQAEQLAEKAGDFFVTVEYMLLAVALASGTELPRSSSATASPRRSLRQAIDEHAQGTQSGQSPPPSRATRRSKSTRATSPRRRGRTSSTR